MSADNQPSEPTPPPTPPAATTAAPPPAASAVLKGKKTERELKLEKELETATKKRKDAELRAMQLEDENRTLKSIPKPPTPPQPPTAPKASSKWTFFDGE